MHLFQKIMKLHFISSSSKDMRNMPHYIDSRAHLKEAFPHQIPSKAHQSPNTLRILRKIEHIFTSVKTQ